MSIKGRLADSAYDFERVVWPELKRVLGGDRVARVEGVPADFCQDLDRAGIDAWYVSGEKMYGVASRVQWLGSEDVLYESFTLKLTDVHGRPSEFYKRLEAIQESSLHPHRTIQAFVARPIREGLLIAASAVKTIDLIAFIERGVEGRDYTIKRNKRDGSRFLAVDWVALRRAGIETATVLGEPYRGWRKRAAKRGPVADPSSWTR